jgi:hypothetical protein
MAAVEATSCRHVFIEMQKLEDDPLNSSSFIVLGNILYNSMYFVYDSIHLELFEQV